MIEYRINSDIFLIVNYYLVALEVNTENKKYLIYTN
jgi:hypothetical protein